MDNSGVHLNDDVLAHMALHHLPVEHLTTRQVIIATAESSNTALTLIGVLSQINELIRDNASSTVSATALSTRLKTTNSRGTTYKSCTNGVHNPKTAHSEGNCWQLHPSKNPHNNSKSSANSASISGRALCAKAYHGAQTNKSILDSGSSHHMFKDIKHFICHQPQETIIEVANGKSMTGLRVGTVSGSSLGAPLTLSGSLHVADLKCNLVSLVQLANKGFSLTFKENGQFEVTQDDEVALTGSIINGHGT